MGLTLLVPHERQPSDRSFLTWKIVRVFLSLSAAFVGLTFCEPHEMQPTDLIFLINPVRQSR